jgi:LysR family cys regulon transcriptional activator
MKFQQLRYLVAVHENGLNITAAARQLHTSQPGVSRQLKLLEEELGFQLFEREGRALTRTTAAGEEIISRAASILREMQNIRRTSAELRKADGGTLSIATTHTQARYVLPQVIRAFRLKYPKVRLHLHQGTSEQIAEMVETASTSRSRPARKSYSLIWCASPSIVGTARLSYRAAIRWRRREN